MNSRILACVHRANSEFGVVGDALKKRGHHLEPYLASGSSPIEAYGGLILYGGPQSANDSDEIIQKEHKLVEEAMKKNVPVLGICLGAQIMARVIGGEVGSHKHKKVEAGFYPITPTERGTKMFPPKLFVYHWHKEGISLPSSAVRLAENENFSVQAFQAQAHQRAYGLQFHPEIHARMIMRWLARDRKEERRLTQPNARAAWEHLPAYLLHRGKVQKWLDDFINMWLN